MSRERVRFKGRDLSLSTVKSYATKKDHPLYLDAKNFLKEKNKKSWTDKLEEDFEDLPKWGPALATPVQVALGKAPKKIGKIFLDNTRDPAQSFSDGFKEAANIDTKKISKSLKKAVKAVFKGNLKKGEEDKISNALTESRQSALEAIGEAAKELAIGGKEVTEGVLWGMFNAGVSGVGKAIGGSAFLIGHTIESQIRQLKKATIKDTSKFEEMLVQFYGNLGKDELGAVAQFVDEDGNFDEKGYKKEMDKALAKIKTNVLKYVKKVNQEKSTGKKKATQRVASLYIRKMMIRRFGR